MKRMPLHWQVLAALLLAVFAGIFIGRIPGPYTPFALKTFDLLGALFLNALKMVMVPLVVSSMISGIGNLGGERSLGRLGAKTVLYYSITTLLAILIGLSMVNLFSPGLSNGEPAKGLMGLTEQSHIIQEKIQDNQGAGFSDFVLRMIPTNIIRAAANGQMLGLIIFSILFGFFMAKAQGQNKGVVLDFFKGVFEILIRLTEWIMRFAPLGVFGLVAKVVATTGLAAFQPLAVFFFTVLAALAIHFGLALPLLLSLIAGIKPFDHYRAMMPALLTAFSTSSSSATLPVTLDCLEKRAGLSNRVSSFVIPLGATVNMDGTALYECVAAMFIAQVYGIDLGIGTQFTIVTLALLTSIGVAGIPAASLVAILIIMDSVGLPAEGIGLILAVDRILDMCRTSVNVFSDSCGAVIIGRSEGEALYRS